MNSGFDLNSFCDSLDDGYGVFDDICDSLDFASVGISTANPDKATEKKTKDSKALVKNTLGGTKKRGRKPGQKPRCGSCGILGHTRRKCAA